MTLHASGPHTFVLPKLHEMTSKTVFQEDPKQDQINRMLHLGCGHASAGKWRFVQVVKTGCGILNGVWQSQLHSVECLFCSISQYCQDQIS